MSFSKYLYFILVILIISFTVESHVSFAKTAKKHTYSHKKISKKSKSTISKPKIKARSGPLSNQEALARLSSREFMPVTDPSRRPLNLGVSRGKAVGPIETYTNQYPSYHSQKIGMPTPGQI